MLIPILDDSQNWFDIDNSHKSNMRSFVNYKSSIDSLHRINKLGSRFKFITKRRKLLKMD